MVGGPILLLLPVIALILDFLFSPSKSNKEDE
jgi:hypothetical protein